MARKESRTVEYFPHQVAHKKTITLLKSKFKSDGYAVFFQTLEKLGKSKDHFFDFSDEIDWLFYVSEMGVSESITKEILDYCVRLRAFDQELYDNNILWSDNFVENLEPVYSKRINDIPTKPVSGPETVIAVTVTDFSGVSGGRSTHSKVKEVKESKEEQVESTVFAEPEKQTKTTQAPLREIIDLWNEKCKHLTPVGVPPALLCHEIQNRWDENPELNFWKDNFFGNFKGSDFLMGKLDFKPDFLWSLDQAKFGRICTDFYKTRKKGEGSEDGQDGLVFNHDTCGACGQFYDGCPDKRMIEAVKPNGCEIYSFDRNSHFKSFGF